ncbi:hypothetical protein MXD62_19565 [Frankia sp. Mgl5]|uniref:hypothetical protein n=1 Tax=Frankia sp. Mgl5 TaxID=2933793 RepID=UPI00200C6F98|nr:hypothetical protein [Frankia sp. Mgl5]MCK9929351.1 hypothetical protein [Frankia sp. Mgl5]
MTGRAHLRPVDTPAPQPEPIAEERIEWGHVLGDFPGREQYGDRDDIHHCWDLDTRAPRTTPCDRTTMNGFPIRHIWRRVITTKWQDGQP